MNTEIINSAAPTESTKETLARDIKGIVNQTDHLFKDASHSLGAEIAAKRHAISEKACGAANATHQYIRSNPWKIAGVAAAVGVFIGTWIRRR